jgi:hypothetical protein
MLTPRIATASFEVMALPRYFSYNAEKSSENSLCGLPKFLPFALAAA